MVHVESSRFAFRPRIHRVIEEDSGRRTVSLSYYIGPRWAAAWDCEFEDSDTGWRPTLCWLVGVA
jgi:hypothetical protein